MHIRGKTKLWGCKNCLQNSETGDTDLGKETEDTDLGKEAQIWGRRQETRIKTQKSAALKVHSGLQILIWKMFGTTRILPRVSLLCGDGINCNIIINNNNNNITATLHWPGLYGSGQTKVSIQWKTHESPLGISKRAPEVLSGLMKPRLNRHRSSPAQYYPSGDSQWWPPHAVGVFFSGRDWATGQGWGKAERSKAQTYGEHGPQRLGPPQTGLKVHLLTWQCCSGLGTTQCMCLSAREPWPTNAPTPLPLPLQFDPPNFNS